MIPGRSPRHGTQSRTADPNAASKDCCPHGCQSRSVKRLRHARRLPPGNGPGGVSAPRQAIADVGRFPIELPAQCVMGDDPGILVIDDVHGTGNAPEVRIMYACSVK